MQSTCSACTELSGGYNRCFSPSEFVLGDPYASLWIVGLNPASHDGKYAEPRTQQDLRSYFQGVRNVHPYFQAFEKVSSQLRDGLFHGKGVAHTDLVKCPTKNRHSETNRPTWAALAEACGTAVLLKQLVQAKPKVILCNGAKVSEFMTEKIAPLDGTGSSAGSYVGEINGQRCRVIRSGFIQRLDRYSQQRLGIELLKAWPQE